MMQETPSMTPNFPDIINCGSVDKPFLMLLDQCAIICWYVQRSDRWMGFKREDGTHHSAAGDISPMRNCLNQSIKQLYDQGRAFNFVNSPEQVQKIQKLEEENKTQKQKAAKQEKQIKN